MLNDAVINNIPLVTDIPTIIFGADVTHPHPGEDSSPSIAAVSFVYLSAVFCMKSYLYIVRSVLNI